MINQLVSQQKMNLLTILIIHNSRLFCNIDILRFLLLQCEDLLLLSLLLSLGLLIGETMCCGLLSIWEAVKDISVLFYVMSRGITVFKSIPFSNLTN